MKQTKTTNCILLYEIENPLISQIIVMLKDGALSSADEAVEISRMMVNNCMKRYRLTHPGKLKRLFLLLAGVIMGIAIGFFI